MNRIPLDSTNLKEVGYDPETKTLEIQFRNDRIYQYYDVPQVIFNGLMAIPDKGFYLRKVIGNAYDYKEIKPNETE